MTCESCGDFAVTYPCPTCMLDVCADCVYTHDCRPDQEEDDIGR